MRPWTAGALLVLLLLPLAAAAPEPLTLNPEQALGNPLSVAPGSTLKLNWSASNPNDEGFVALLGASGPDGWNVTVQPPSFELPERSEGAVRSFTVLVQVPERAAPHPGSLVVRLAGANSTTGDTLSQELDVPLLVAYQGLVLGRFHNPLPAPLDNAYGVFALDLAFWALVAAALVALQGPLVRFLTRHAEKHVGAKIITTLRTPIFLTIVFFGITQAWDALPPGWWVDDGHRILASALILVTMYVVYKVFRAVLIYYIENIAAKTESELDDILMPVLEKVGGVVIVAAGALYFVSTLGIDLGAFVAGGVVVSMVLAFAAQDTLSNFFAGLFLMLDRPFIRGDDIMLIGGGPLEGNVFRVDEVGLRTSRLYHYQRHQLVIMPNNDLAKNPIVNLMKPDTRLRALVRVGVDYAADPAQVKALLERAAREHPDSDKAPGFEPNAYLEKFGESSVDYVVKFFHRVERDRDRSRIPGEVQERIHRDLAAAGIDIPFPQRVITVKGELPDAGNGGPEARAEMQERAKGP